jgi:putative flavoprotein involved in K+ transport
MSASAARPPSFADVLLLGGGQSALAVGYHLRRTGLDWAILDDQPGPGGGWRHTWPSLRLFSPARYSSLPGRLMPQDPSAPGPDGYPSRAHVMAYLEDYETRYSLPVERPVRVTGVFRDAEGRGLVVETDQGPRGALAVVSATGTWAAPRIPPLPGARAFGGRVLHSAHYPGPDPFRGERVLVVGGGNSGAQIMAELAPVSRATWVTLEPPVFLPESVDGRDLFDQATAAWKARQEGRPPPPPLSLGDIVQVPPVREARARGHLEAVRPFVRFNPTGVTWPDGRNEAVDSVIWCTGFAPALDHLAPLGVVGPDGRVAVEGTRSVAEPRLWLVGYGGWTGFASATLVGVGRSARQTAQEVEAFLRTERGQDLP